MRISISSAAIFLSIFLLLPTVMFGRLLGLPPQTYHASDNEGGHSEYATWHNIKTENIVLQGNNSNNTSEDMIMRKRYKGDGQMERHKKAHPLQVAAGSRLPDCSHACGSCTPCRLVMISFVCASLAEAETCPISYRCICNDKSYPVP